METSTAQRRTRPLTYSREELLELAKNKHGLRHRVPAELQLRYRGCKAGAKVQARRTENRRRQKPSLPSVIMGNVNSLANKIDELAALGNQRIYRECSLFILTETWLTATIPDGNVDLRGFTAVRADRDTKVCGKSKGGGLIIYTNNRWCNPGHVSVKAVLCCPNLELLAVSMRPYYLPREFSHVIALCVYIAPTANGATACEKIHSVAARLQTKHPEALLIISGDFNHVTLDSTLAALHQVIDCPTRNNRTIDLLYTNIKEVYGVIALPPLGKSDHNLVYVQPQYTPLVQRQAASTGSIRRWTPEAEEALKDCFNITDWDVLLVEHEEDIDGMTDRLTDYLNFCVDVVVPTKTVQCYPNNKPWVTQEVKDVLNKKKKAFRNKDREKMKEAQREVKRCLKEAKNTYRKKVEKKLADNNMRDVWEGVRTITGHKAKTSTEEGGVERANDLNQFFNSSRAPLYPPSLQPATHHNFPQPASPPPSSTSPPSADLLLPPFHLYNPIFLLSPSPHPPCIPLLSPSPHPPCFTADQTFKYLGLWLDNRLDWTSNTRQLYKKTQSRIYFLRRLRSFNICRKLLWMFYQSVVASVLSYAVVCWGGSATKADLSRLEKLIRRASSVVGMKLKPLATVTERRTIDKLRSIMDNDRHPLHTVIHSQRSLISQRLRLPKFRTNRLGNSFIPRAIRLFNSSLGGRRQQKPSKEEEPKGLSWKDKPLHGMYHQQIEEVAHIKKTYQWLEKAGLKRQHKGTTHGCTRTGPEHQSNRGPCLSYRQDPRYRLYGDAPETVQHITADCKMLAGKAYMERHSQVAGEQADQYSVGLPDGD
ncbi:hypothetical protein D4764_12G0008410 [Takifugu flavidus]|uniref:Alkylated DNA repair protein AlkB homologue 8 N-terminal domain-containing protein n=1 Tax=Takifugu flavidus TaxID=433684 RepID=A0A5C6PF45_9TELE|nr:hypothetical protein D4764_12G0008410 [Takifugu flavidus]